MDRVCQSHLKMYFHQFIYYFLIFKLLYFKKMRELERHFASKTPYSIIQNLDVNNDKFRAIGKPHKIWMVIRHGTRSPNIRQVNKMNTTLPLIRNKIAKHLPYPNKNLSKSETNLLFKAVTKFNTEDCGRLTCMGKCEMVSLAERMQKRFPDVLVTHYNKEIYQFRLTHTDRTLESAQFFAKGLFGMSLPDNSIELKEDEALLRFYKLCAKWQNEIRHHPFISDEIKFFQNSSSAVKAIEKVNKKLGTDNHLTFDDVELMYKACIAETCSSKISAWCIPFEVSVIKIMEFGEDLKHYWLDGYGFEITYKHACPLFKNMIDFFNSGRKYPKVILNFTHSGALLKMLAHLELYKDDKPLRYNDFDVLENRKWRLSKIGGFGSNIVFILYNINDTYKVLVLHQEKIVRLPCCPDSDLCELEVIKEYYKSSLTDCKLDKICGNL